jgi:glutathione S-transferase
MEPTMPLQLYTLSGSPFGWKVQLALEHLSLPHVVTMLSSDKGDLRQPRFQALNPHGKVPVLLDGATTLYESDVIVEYLEETRAGPSTSLWPDGPIARAMARRIAVEASSYVYPPLRQLVTRWAGRPEPDLDRATIDGIKQTLSDQLRIIAPHFSGGFVAGARPGAADYAVYPLVALIKRLDKRRPDESLAALVPEELLAWSSRIEALPYFDRTYPPHWKG